jgi:hypothetical protein
LWQLGGNDSILSVASLKPSETDDTVESSNSPSHGLALSQDGTILAVGEPTRDQVNVYQYQNATWTRLGQTITGGAQFGHAVALSSNGTVLAVGAATGRTRGNLVIGQVSVFVFWPDSGVWVRHGPNLNGGAVGENFGSTVSLSGDGTVLVVSSSGNGLNLGHVGTYTWDEACATWRWDQIFGNSQGINAAIAGAAVSAKGLVIAMDTATAVVVTRLIYCGAEQYQGNASNLPLCSDYYSTSSSSASPSVAPQGEDELDVSTNAERSNGTTLSTTSARGESDSLDHPSLGVWLAIVAAAILVIVATGWKWRFRASKRRWANRAEEPKSEIAASLAAESNLSNVDAPRNHEEAFSERIPLEPLAPLSMARMGEEHALSVNQHEDCNPLDCMPAMSARALEPPGEQLFSEDCPYKDQFGDDDHAPAAVLVVGAPCPYKDQFGDNCHAPEVRHTRSP